MSTSAILKPIKTDSTFYLIDVNNVSYNIPNNDCLNISEISYRQGKNVFVYFDKSNSTFKARKTGGEINDTTKFIELKNFETNSNEMPNNASKDIVQDTQGELIKFDEKKFIHTTEIPKGLYISHSKWKYLIRSILKGKNILITGPSGCGKTISLLYSANIFKDRPQFFIPLGSTQDPRTTLIGNTHFNKETGTIFNKSYFVKAIETPNAIIILDEISRAHPEAGNILMSVLDYHQRFLRLDEEFDTPTINVASGVTFMSTANVGAEYTYTRKLDRALLDRFGILEMDILTKDQEFDLLSNKFPTVDTNILMNISEIVDTTRKEILKPDSKVQTILSTRSSIEIAELISDGFSLHEAADIHIYPLFSNAGGETSERTFIKQLVQKYLKNVDSNQF